MAKLISDLTDWGLWMLYRNELNVRSDSGNDYTSPYLAEYKAELDRRGIDEERGKELQRIHTGRGKAPAFQEAK